MSKIDEMARYLAGNSGKSKTSSYDTQAEVIRVKDDIAYVHIPGGIAETPVKHTINVEKGDIVQVRVSNRTAWITGNISAPPTDDKKANIAVTKATEVKKDVTELTNSFIQNSQIVNAEIENLKAKDSVIENSVIQNSEIIDSHVDKFNVIDGVVQGLQATDATIQGKLTANEADINSLKAKDAVIENLVAQKADIAELEANYAHISNGVIDNAKIGYADVDDLNVHYANIDLANVNNAWIDNGVIKDAAISDAQIIGVSANKLTAGTIDASKIDVTNLNADNLTVGTINGKRIGKASIDLEKLAEEVPTKEYLDNVQKNLQGQIDGQIETWTGSAVPTLNNAPASSWSTAADRKKHVGDIYYVVNVGNSADGYTYRFTENPNGTYGWTLIKDNQITKALQDILDIQGDVSGIKQFDTEISSWKTDTDNELSSIKSRTSTLETDMGKKVSTTTFNELKQEVDENSATITSLSETVDTKADGGTVTTLSNTVNTVKQTADTNKSNIESLTKTVTDNETDIEQKYSNLSQDLSGFKVSVGSTYTKSSDFTSYKTSNDAAVKAAQDDASDAKSSASASATSAANAASSASASETAAKNAQNAAEAIQTKADNGDFDGRGVKSTAVTYQVGASGTTAPTGNWSTSPVATTAQGQYLWTRTVITYTDNTSSTSYSVAAHGTTGAKGDQGIQGVKGDKGDAGTSVTVSKTEYQSGTSPTSAPTGTWQTTVPTVAEGNYLWTRVTYSDGKIAYSVAKQGAKGSTGAKGDKGDAGTSVTVSSIKYSVSSTETQPADSTFTYTTVPTVAEGSWLWTLTTYSDGKKAYTKAKQGAKGDKGDQGAKGDTGVQGPQGAKGDKGDKGATGNTGKSLVSVTEYYALNNSTTAPADSAFGTDVKSPTSANKYVWNYELMSWNDNGTTSTTKTDKHIVAVYGDKGDTGSKGDKGDKGNTGKALTAITEYYAINNSTTAPADSSFSTEVKAPTASNKYLWNYEVMSWNDNGTTSTTKTDKHIAAVYGDKGDKGDTGAQGAKGDKGDKGDTGAAVVDVKPLYYLKSNATAPSKPTSEVTSTSTAANVWTTVVPTYQSGYVYFTCLQTKYSSGTSPQWSNVVQDNELMGVYSDLNSIKTNYVTKTDWSTENGKIRGEVSDVETTTKSYTDGKITQEVKDRNSAIEAKADEINLSVGKVESKLTQSTEIIYGTQTTSTYNWTGKSNSLSAIADGTSIIYWLPYSIGGSAVSATYLRLSDKVNVTTTGAALNLTLSDGTNTGNIPIWYSGVNRVTSHYGYGSLVRMIYRKDVTVAGAYTATGWWIDGNYDSGNTTDNVVTYFGGKTGGKGIWATSLFMETSAGTYENICTASDGTVTTGNRTVATTKKANTTGFKVGGTVFYTTTSYNANSNIAGWRVVYTQCTSLFDSRYSLNTTLTANSLTTYKPIYLVGTIGSDGLFYLDATWWTQTPTTKGKVYILLGSCYDSTTSQCRIMLYEDNYWYIYDGSKLVDYASAYTNAQIAVTDGKISAEVTARENLGKSTTATLELKANKATLTTEINASADTAKIKADRVEIDGAAIFSNTDFKKAADAAYDAKGAASDSIDALKTDLASSTGTTVINGGHIDTGSITIGQINNLQSTLNGKQAAGSYATTAQLTTEINQRKASYATSTTDAGVQAKTATCANFELYTGAIVTVTFSKNNTHATPTLNVNSTGAKTIRSYTGAALSAAEYQWAAGAAITFVYDGTYWRMQDGGALQAKAAAASSASAASTSATNAASSASTASTKASEASTSATNAASSASTASTKASEASTSASTASSKATAASTSATNAANSAASASTSATNAANAVDWTISIEITAINYASNTATLKATVYKGGVVQTSGFTLQWYKGSTKITSDGTSATLSVTDLNAAYTCIAS